MFRFVLVVVSILVVLALAPLLGSAQELSFVEAEVVPEAPPSACPDVSPGDLVVSPDGKHLYVTYDVCIGNDQIAIYGRSAGGALEFLAFHPIDANPSGIAITPDGLAVFYITNNGRLEALRRDPATGLLAYADYEYDDQDGVTSLKFARDLAVSPDGQHLYVVGQENALTSFAWDAVAGTLTLADTDADGTGTLVLGYPDFVAVSPDGAFVYVASSFSDDLNVFGRDGATGAVEPLVRFVDGVEGVDGLEAPAGLAVAPTATPGTASVYVASFGDGAAARFAQGLPNESPAIAFVESEPLFTWPAAMVVPASGDRLFVTDVAANGVRALARDPATGALGAELDAITNGDVGGIGLTQPRFLARSADDRNLYATGSDDAIAVLQVPEPGGAASAVAAALALVALARRAR